jgi:hypothetical protein
MVWKGAKRKMALCYDDGHQYSKWKLIFHNHLIMFW